MNPNYTTVLKAFSSLPHSPDVRPTFMNIAGYPHYENVCCNILRFFFDPASPHGLGSLLIDALLRARSLTATLENVKVDREVRTRAGNRLDLLIESDDYLIAIENKIFAGIGNPFDDYSVLLSEKAKGRRILKLILMLDAAHESPSHGFAVLRYSDFIEAIRTLVGHYVSGANPSYVIFLLDFLDNMDKLQKGPQMDQNMVNLFKEHEEQIQELLKEVNNFRAELRNRVQELGSLIELAQYPNVKQWLYRTAEELADTLVHDIKLGSDLVIAIDTVVSAKGWEAQMFTRKAGNMEKLKTLLQTLAIPFEATDRFIYHIRFPLTDPLVKVQGHLQGILGKIASSQSPPP